MSKPNMQIRPLDDLGRIVIPGDMRELLGWKSGVRLELSVGDTDSQFITIREAHPRCSLCWKEPEELLPVANGFVCGQCKESIKK
mgnify:FL=1